VRALVTTAPSGSYDEVQRLAAKFGLCAEPRSDRILTELAAAAGGAPVFVLGSRRADLHVGGVSYRASTGIAVLRVLRARNGETDPLVEAAGLRRGDEVLDATLGLGGDALVAAHVTECRVSGVEVDPVLAAFVEAGLRRVPPIARDAASRIEVRCADHTALLRDLPARTYDVVLIDPMFRDPGNAGPLFTLLRTRAEHKPLRADTLAEARRVARRGVLVKDAAPGGELARLGLEPRPSRRGARVVFGWASGD
jgi:16S rRNA (guanine1516-N2)-methyltransferase